MFYLTTHSTHFIYGYMASDIWLRTILIVRKETRCRHIGYSYRLTARVLLYAPSHRQDSTYHGLCYTSRNTSNAIIIIIKKKKKMFALFRSDILYKYWNHILFYFRIWRLFINLVSVSCSRHRLLRNRATSAARLGTPSQ